MLRQEHVLLHASLTIFFLRWPGLETAGKGSLLKVEICFCFKFVYLFV